MGVDMGGPVAGALPLPGGVGAAALKMQRLYRNRQKKTYSELYKYVLDDDVREVLRTTYFGLGYDAYLYVESLYDRPITTAELTRLLAAIGTGELDGSSIMEFEAQQRAWQRIVSC